MQRQISSSVYMGLGEGVGVRNIMYLNPSTRYSQIQVGLK